MVDIPKLAKIFEDELLRLTADRSIQAITDFPNHNNVGDSAIFLGELAALKNIGRNSNSINVFDAIDRHSKIDLLKPKDDCILFNGGGNFGDLYPLHHNLRIDLISHFRMNRIIQLPVSLHFSGDRVLQETQRTIDAHPDFHLMVRDKTSALFAEKHFNCPVYLVPDAALSLRSLQEFRVPAKAEILRLARTDKESVLNNYVFRRRPVDEGRDSLICRQ